MEVKIYDKEGRVISEVQSDESIDIQGHYEFKLSESETEVAFIKLKKANRAK